MKSNKSSNTEIDQVLELDQKYGRRRRLKRWIILIVIFIFGMSVIFAHRNKKGQNIPNYEMQ